MKWCRVINADNKVVDCTDRDPTTSYHPSLAEQFIQCPDEVQNGWYRWSDGTFSPKFESYWRTILTRFEFLSLFTLAERTAIRTAAKTDAIIEDLISMINIAENIDVKLPMTIEGLDYLVVQNLLTAERAETIKKGIYVEDES